MDIPTKAIVFAQDAQTGDHELCGTVSIPYHPRAQEEPLYAVAPVEPDGEIRQLLGCEAGTHHIRIAAPIDAVGAIIDADIGHEHLQKRDAATIFREAVATACLTASAQLTAFARPVNSRRGTGHIILGRIREDLQLLEDVHSMLPNICSSECLFA